MISDCVDVGGANMSDARRPDLSSLLERALIGEMNSVGIRLRLPVIPWRVLGFPDGPIVCGFIHGPDAIASCLPWVAAFSMGELFTWRADDSREWGMSDGLWRIELIGSVTPLRISVGDRREPGFLELDNSDLVGWADVWQKLGLS